MKKTKLRFRELSNEKLSILLHAIGLDDYGNGNIFRNHYCPAGEKVSLCNELVFAGYMTNGKYTPYNPPFLYHVTEVTIYSLALEISMLKKSKNCINCANMKTVYSFFVCDRSKDKRLKEKVITISEMIKSKRCYQGAFNSSM